MLLVLVSMWSWGHNILLERLDQEDEQVLLVEADRLRAMMEVLFNRDVDRLTNLSTLIQRQGASALSGEIGFDVLIESRSGAFTILQPLLKRKRLSSVGVSFEKSQQFASRNR
ncbi:hypothetical protein PPS11_27196 [Pseudomonas putida S11]|nr:hypothetical protein PPS11_27196 [Pseudomonas putida S11]